MNIQERMNIVARIADKENTAFPDQAAVDNYIRELLSSHHAKRYPDAKYSPQRVSSTCWVLHIGLVLTDSTRCTCYVEHRIPWEELHQKIALARAHVLNARPGSQPSRKEHLHALNLPWMHQWGDPSGFSTQEQADDYYAALRGQIALDQRTLWRDRLARGELQEKIGFSIMTHDTADAPNCIRVEVTAPEANPAFHMQRIQGVLSKEFQDWVNADSTRRGAYEAGAFAPWMKDTGKLAYYDTKTCTEIPAYTVEAVVRSHARNKPIGADEAELDRRIHQRFGFSSREQAETYIKAMLATSDLREYADCPYEVKQFNTAGEWEINLIVPAPGHDDKTYTVNIDRHTHVNALWRHIKECLPEILRQNKDAEPDDLDDPSGFADAAETPTSKTAQVYKGGWQSRQQVEEFIAKADKDYFDNAERCDMALVYGLVGSEFGEEHALVMAYQPPGFIGRTRSLPPYRVVLKEVPSSTHQLLVIYNAMKDIYGLGQQVGRDKAIAKLTSNIAKLM
jgi:hypothetical protein